jgi:hypothetical protein
MHQSAKQFTVLSTVPLFNPILLSPLEEKIMMVIAEKIIE